MAAIQEALKGLRDRTSSRNKALLARSRSLSSAYAKQVNAVLGKGAALRDNYLKQAKAREARLAELNQDYADRTSGVLSKQHLDALLKAALNSKVPTFTSFLAGYELAKASAAEREAQALATKEVALIRQNKTDKEALADVRAQDRRILEASAKVLADEQAALRDTARYNQNADEQITRTLSQDALQEDRQAAALEQAKQRGATKGATGSALADTLNALRPVAPPVGVSAALPELPAPASAASVTEASGTTTLTEAQVAALRPLSNSTELRNANISPADLNNRVAKALQGGAVTQQEALAAGYSLEETTTDPAKAAVAKAISIVDSIATAPAVTAPAATAPAATAPAATAPAATAPAVTAPAATAPAALLPDAPKTQAFLTDYLDKTGLDQERKDAVRTSFALLANPTLDATAFEANKQVLADAFKEINLTDQEVLDELQGLSYGGGN